jgi:hypothetical protein
MSYFPCQQHVLGIEKEVLSAEVVTGGRYDETGMVGLDNKRMNSQ